MEVTVGLTTINRQINSDDTQRSNGKMEKSHVIGFPFHTLRGFMPVKLHWFPVVVVVGAQLRPTSRHSQPRIDITPTFPTAGASSVVTSGIAAAPVTGHPCVYLRSSLRLVVPVLLDVEV